MYHQVKKAVDPNQYKNLWHLVQRIIAYHGPINSKEIFEIAEKATNEDLRSPNYFKQRVLLPMKEYGIITIKSNNYIISDASRQIMREKTEFYNKLSQKEKTDMALQALRGINVSKANLPSKKKRRDERAKMNLPEPRYAWYLNASPEKIQEWKEAGIPLDSDLKELLAKHGDALFAIEKVPIIPLDQQQKQERKQL
jgi:hypothetical protein